MTGADPARPASARLIVVAAALIDADGRLLVQKRAKDRSVPGLWEFPGGKCEDREQLEDALIRELDEELGIVVDRAALAPAVFASESLGDREMLLLLYICRKWRGEPRPLDAEALRWVDLSELRALAMPPADKPLVHMLETLLQPQQT